MEFKVYFIAFLFILPGIIYGQNNYLEAELQPGDGLYSLLKRYNLNTNSDNIQLFKKINNMDDDLTLKKHITYKLPVNVYTYDGKSIRSTIGINDWDQAVKIQEYNEAMHKAGLRNSDYRADHILWVPVDINQLKAPVEAEKENHLIVPLFGEDFENVEIIDDYLKGNVYYIVAGHGGPDPGAIAKYGGHTLCEDEYAYDISLRLARNLIQHSATVYMITRDNNDGIRNEAYLKPDQDEVCYPNQEIPLNQIKRLNQRVDEINKLYKEHKTQGAGKQRVIIIHVDSRSSTQRIDMFFYYNPKSKSGKNLAEILRNTIDEKYSIHQKGRGYSGTVKARNLHMLRETNPVAVYAELGNIRNTADQRRFIIEDNRQAVANWLTEGLMKEK